MELPFITRLETSVGYTLYQLAKLANKKARKAKSTWGIAVGDYGIWLKTPGYPDIIEVQAVPSCGYTLEEAFKIMEAKAAWYAKKLSPQHLKRLCRQALAAQDGQDKVASHPVIDLLLKGKLKEGYAVYRHLDTFVREGFPDRLVYEMAHRPKA